MNLERTVRKALGPERLGKLDYYLRPSLRRSGASVFNGQERRREVFLAMLESLPLKAIVETGTFRGATTRFLAERSGLPVYTVESGLRRHSFSVLQLASLPRVRVSLGDSRSFLLELARDPEVAKDDVFFYLDAHWGHDLPLREEVEIVFGHWKDSVVMIDDFQVPGTDYGYDDYGPGRALDLAYLAPLARLGLRVYFPVATPEQETGARRGWVVLCRDDAVAERLDRLPGLARHAPGLGA